jgi:hypothetical protein
MICVVWILEYGGYAIGTATVTEPMLWGCRAGVILRSVAVYVTDGTRLAQVTISVEVWDILPPRLRVDETKLVG